MPAIDDPFGLAASLPGQLADLRRQIKDLSSNNTQAVSQALAAASAAAASATTASNAATSASNAATSASNAATTTANAATTTANSATTASNAATTAANSATTASNSATTAANAATAASTAATNAKVTGVIGSGSVSGYTLSTSYATLALFGLTVPAGFTRAIVLVSAFATGTTNTSSVDRIYVQTVINGVAGPESIGQMVAAMPWGSAAAFQTQNLSGLTPGAAISISVQSHVASSPGPALYTNATVSALAIFQV